MEAINISGELNYTPKCCRNASSLFVITFISPLKRRLSKHVLFVLAFASSNDSNSQAGAVQNKHHLQSRATWRLSRLKLRREERIAPTSECHFLSRLQATNIIPLNITKELYFLITDDYPSLRRFRRVVIWKVLSFSLPADSDDRDL